MKNSPFCANRIFPLLGLTLLTLVFAPCARATDYNFNADQRRIEQNDGTPFNPQAVAGVLATLTNGEAGVVASDGVVEFSFPATLNFSAADRVFFRGSVRPIRLIVNGNILIPAGMVVDASGTIGTGFGQGAGGGAGGSGTGTKGAGGVGGATTGQAAGGVGGAASPQFSIAGKPGATGLGGNPGNASGTAPTSRAGANGFAAPNSGGASLGTGLSSTGGLAGVSASATAPGGTGGAAYSDGSDGSNGATGSAGSSGGSGVNGTPGNGGLYANPNRTLLGGGGGGSGMGGGGGAGGGSGAGGGGGGGGGNAGPIFLLGYPGEAGGNGGRGGAGGAGGTGGVGIDAASGGNGGGAFELRATGLISVGGTLRANGAPGGTSNVLPIAGGNGAAGQSGVAGIKDVNQDANPDGGDGGDGAAGTAGGTGGGGGLGGNGGGGAGGTIILRAGTAVQKLAGAVLQANGGAGTKSGQNGLVLEVSPLGLIGLENFNYGAPAALAGKTGGTFFDWDNVARAHISTASSWDNTSGTPQTTSSGTLVTASSGVKREYNGANETNGAFQNPDVIYYKVEMTRGADAVNSGVSSQNLNSERLFFGVPFSTEPSTGERRFGIDIIGGSVTYSAIKPVAGVRYTIVSKVDYGNQRVSLWVNPRLGVPESDNPPDATAAYTATGERSTALRLASGGTATWDNLAVSGTWQALSVAVTTLADKDGGSLFGDAANGLSLREAIKYAPPGSLINFSPELSGGTIRLLSSIPVTRNVVVDGTDLLDSLTLSGGSNGDDVLDAGENAHLDLQTGADFRLVGLTLADGTSSSAGSTRQTGGIALFERCLFTRNVSTGNGGAIQATGGSLAVNNCTFVENRAVRGGALFLDNTISAAALSQCTITGNRASSEGGGIRNVSMVAFLDYSIVAENVAPAGAQIQGGFTTNSPNLTSGNPKLAPLGRYGGPTATRPPLIGSLAIDTGGSSDPGGTDQRGFPRFVDGDRSGAAQFDLGAVEAGPLLLVTSGGNDAGSTLRTRITQSLATPGGRIGFASGIESQPILLSSELAIPANANGLFIDASDLPSPVTVSGNNAVRVFNVAAGATVAMQRLAIVNGRVPDSANGGGILSFGTVVLNQTTLAGNVAGSGGAIYSFAIRLSLNGSTLSGNSAIYGGGILHDFGTLTLDQSTLSANAANFGGGILNYGTLILTQSTLVGNSGGFANGIFNRGNMTLKNNIVADNGADNIFGPFTSIGNNVTTGDPKLTLLGSYGGPTQTMLPLPGSPALDAAVGTGPDTDQRGFPRPVGASRDLGSVEAAPGSDYLVVANKADSGSGSLRQLLGDAVSGQLILFDPQIFTGGAANRIALAAELVPAAGKILQIDATYVNGLTLDAGSTNIRVLRVPAGGNLSLRATTVRGGRASFGGGVRNDGVLTLERCTLTDNQSSNRSGAIENAENATLLLDRCTLTGNRATGDGGAMFNLGTATVRSCTIVENVCTNNAGGIYNVSALTLASSIIAGNYRNSPTSPSDLAGDVFATQGGNLFGVNTDAATANPVGLPNANGDYVGNGSAPLDPLLAPLAPRGGPTETRPPLPGSPALDRAPNAIGFTDQRGFARAVGSFSDRTNIPDIGAVERGPVLFVSNSADSGRGSLRDTLLAAAAMPDTRLQFDPILNGQTITLTSAELAVPAGVNVEVDASSLPAGLTVSGANARKIFNVQGILSLHRLTLTGGSSVFGGALSFDGNLLAVDCSFTGNTGSVLGGALYMNGGTLDLLRCSFTGNAAGDGGAITLAGPSSRSTLTNCTIANNRGTADSGTGGMTVFDGAVTLVHTTISANTGFNGGGGLYMEDAAQVRIERCIIAGNVDPGTSAVDVFQNGGTLTAVGPSLIGSNGSPGGGGNIQSQFPAGQPNANGSYVGTSSARLDPLLAPLGDYGGPTPTMALKPGSQAREHAAGSTVLTDQRNFPRLGTPDLGAYEAGWDTNFNAFIYETLPATATDAQHAATFDYDGDSSSNGNEYLAGTIVTNPASFLRITAFTRAASSLNVTFPTVAGRTYAIEESSDLATWTLLLGNIAGTGSPRTFTLGPLTGFTQYFLRVRVIR